MKKFNQTLFTDNKRALDRNFGGNIASQEPFITGYFFTKWYLPTNIQPMLTQMDPEAFPSSSAISVQQSVLQATCQSITQPGRTLNKTTFNGIGGLKWSVPTMLDYSDTVSASFVEYSGTPLTKIFQAWVNTIRNGTYGTSPSQDATSKASYAGQLLVYITDPTGLNIERQTLYTGLFPGKTLEDSYSQDITNVDKLTFDMDFSIDKIMQGLDFAEVNEMAQDVVNLYKASGASQLFDASTNQAIISNDPIYNSTSPFDK